MIEMGPKKSHNLSGQQKYVTSLNKKITQALGTKKITQPLGQKKSCNLSGQKNTRSQ